MSRWLRNVNALLETLDDTVAETVERTEERREEELLSAHEESDDVGGGDESGVDETGGAVGGVGAAPLASKRSVEGILAKRGLLGEEEEEEGGANDSKDGREVLEEEDRSSGGTSDQPPEAAASAEGAVVQERAPPSGAPSLPASDLGSGLEAPSVATERNEEEQAAEEASDASVTASITSSAPPSAPLQVPDHRAAAADARGSDALVAEAEAAESLLLETTRKYQRAAEESKQSAKECRKLRRQIVKLDAALEASELEITAQRSELERAAERMERDRARHREERDDVAKRHKEEIDALKKEHERALVAVADAANDKLAAADERASRAEEAREREGGDWTKELREAVEREKEIVEKVALLEDEKTTLSSQVASLESQIKALTSRSDRADEMAETAREREREADDRLDAALSLHARQMGQRQAREAELERTVAELGAALVAGRERERRASRNADGKLRSDGGIIKEGEGTGEETGSGGPESLRSRLRVSEEETENLRAQLDLERSRCSALESELHDVSRERTEEASAARAREKGRDRREADLTAAVRRLRTEVQDLREGGGGDDDGGDDVGKRAEPAENRRRSKLEEERDDLRSQVAALTKTALRQQGRAEGSAAEIATLRGRLRTALSRAENAERALTESQNFNHRGGGMDIETGLPPYDKRGKKVRRKAKAGRSKGILGGGKGGAGSMRRAFGLDPGQGGGHSEMREAAGALVDALDSWTLETGAALRASPVARGAFMAYLAILHLWTFCVVTFHAHGGLEMDGAAGDGTLATAGHGPHSVVGKLSYRHLEQLHRSP